MQFTPGQTVIHPHHGPATVTELFDRPVGGRPTTFLGLVVHRTDLRVCVPVGKAEEIGLRPVCAEQDAARLVEVLRAPSGEQEETWSRRIKANHELLRQGDLLVTAGVARDLMRRDAERGISQGERELLRHAQRLVCAELALSLGLDDTEAEQLLATSVLDSAAAAAVSR